MKLPRGVLALLVVTAAPGVSQTAPVTFMPPASLEKAPDPDGFLERWVLLEPIEANGLTRR